MAEKIPGGRLLFFSLPIALFLAAYLILETKDLIQVCNWVILALTAAVTVSWRRSISTFVREREDAGLVWLSLGVFTIVVVTVLNIGYSSWLRVSSVPLDTTSSPIIAVVRFSYAFGFGCLYLVPLARDAIVPPTGWISLIAVVAVSAGLTLFCMWLM